MLPKVKKEAQKRLNRISGQVGGIQHLVEEERYCIDILTCISAVRAALHQLELVVVKGDMETWVSSAIKENKGEELISELDQTLTKFLR